MGDQACVDAICNPETVEVQGYFSQLTSAHFALNSPLNILIVKFVLYHARNLVTLIFNPVK